MAAWTGLPSSLRVSPSLSCHFPSCLFTGWHLVKVLNHSYDMDLKCLLMAPGGFIPGCWHSCEFMEPSGSGTYKMKVKSPWMWPSKDVGILAPSFLCFQAAVREIFSSCGLRQHRVPLTPLTVFAKSLLP